MVKRYLKIVVPEKWKDRNRRDYIGTSLIYRNQPDDIQEVIERQIEIDYPDISAAERTGDAHIKWDRHFIIEYKDYLMNLCRKYGLTINQSTIEDSINNVLEYNTPRYNKEQAIYFKGLFEKFGSYTKVEDFLDSNTNVFMSRNTISNRIKSLFGETDYIEIFGVNGYIQWFENNNIIFNNENNKVHQFSLHLKKIVSVFIFQLLIEDINKLSNNEILLKLRDYFNSRYEIDKNGEKYYFFGRMVYLLSDTVFGKILTQYLEKLITLVKYLKINSQDLDLPTTFRAKLDLEIDTTHIKKIIDHLREKFPQSF